MWNCKVPLGDLIISTTQLNTVKFLLGVVLNSAITFISKKYTYILHVYIYI